MINTEQERQYLDCNDFVKNENGRYVYANRNGEHLVDMECILEDYYEWRREQDLKLHEKKKTWWQFWKINIKPVL